MKQFFLAPLRLRALGKMNASDERSRHSCFHRQRSFVLLRVLEDATLVVGVVEFGTVRSGTAANLQKNLGRAEHAQRQRYEIDPNRVPIAGAQC